ncbi:MAG: hypothetical protein WC599_12380 [Bacteroidales bacterium]
MKNLMLSIGMLAISALILTNCQKNKEKQTPSDVNALTVMNQAYNSARNYNDSVKHYYTLNNMMMTGMCSHYDNLYHNCDSSFTQCYSQCMQMMGDSGMMGNGGGMGNGGMMGGNGGMMGGTGMNCNTGSMSDMMTLVNNMNTLRQTHNAYHK